MVAVVDLVSAIDIFMGAEKLIVGADHFHGLRVLADTSALRSSRLRLAGNKRERTQRLLRSQIPPTLSLG
jgi:hypothetical protein